MHSVVDRLLGGLRKDNQPENLEVREFFRELVEMPEDQDNDSERVPDLV